MSTFSGLNTARTALWASQRGLDLTGQNIANVNTDGYSRQRLDLQSIGGTAVSAIHSVSNGLGGGVSAEEVTRIRDAFLEGRAHTEHANSARLTAQADTYARVEQAFREPGPTGIQSMLADVSNGWQDVANHPDDLAARGQLLRRLQTLTSGLHATRTSLDQQWTQTRDNLAVLVSDVNAAAGDIAKLNASIRRATAAGIPTNELKDKRDALVLSLATQVGATTVPGDDGQLNVLIGGTAVVSGDGAMTIALTGATGPDGALTDSPTIVTVPGRARLQVGGTAEGQLATLTDAVPTYRTELDGIARTLVSSLNAAHGAGWDLDGDRGMPLLDNGDGSTTTVDPATVNAGNIRVRVVRPQDIAAAKVNPATTGGPTLDGGNADAITELSLDPASTEATYRALIVKLGVQSAVATRNLDIQAVITGQVDASRESVSGVSIDEEMTTMLSFQHAYSAAARLVTAVDEMLDTLINRTGLVGR